MEPICARVAKGGEEKKPALSSSKGNSDMQCIMEMLQQILQIHSSNSPLWAFPVSFPSALLKENFPVPPTPGLPYLYLCLAKFSQCPQQAETAEGAEGLRRWGVGSLAGPCHRVDRTSRGRIPRAAFSPAAQPLVFLPWTSGSCSASFLALSLFLLHSIGKSLI